MIIIVARCKRGVNDSQRDGPVRRVRRKSGARGRKAGRVKHGKANTPHTDRPVFRRIFRTRCDDRQARFTFTLQLRISMSINTRVTRFGHPGIECGEVFCIVEFVFSDVRWSVDTMRPSENEHRGYIHECAQFRLWMGLVGAWICALDVGWNCFIFGALGYVDQDHANWYASIDRDWGVLVLLLFSSNWYLMTYYFDPSLANRCPLIAKDLSNLAWGSLAPL